MPVPSRLRLAVRRYSNVSVVLGLFLLGFAGMIVIEEMLFQWSGKRHLESAQAAEPAAERSGAIVGAAAKPRRAGPGFIRPKRGEPIATLEIERLGLSVVVLEGSDDAILKLGPGHIEDTAYPGQLGNIAIAGHRDTHFRPLRSLRPNDEILLRSPSSGTLRYYVASTVVIDPTEMDLLDPTPGAALTLVTCFPFEYVGNAPRRFVVRALPKTQPPDTDDRSSSAGVQR